MMLHRITTSTLTVVLLTVSISSAQTVDPAKLKIRGVGLDSTYAQVIRALGRPKSETKPKKEECIGGHEKNVTYAGLDLYFMDGDSRNGKTFEVKGFEVSSAAWPVSGIKVGDSEAVVKRKLGRHFAVEKDQETGGTFWGYDMGDNGPGTTSILFKKGKVVSISSTYQVC